MEVNFLKDVLVNTRIQKPLSGTLSGHAAGEPFDKHVQELLIAKYPNKVKRQYEFLNELFTLNSNVNTFEERANLIHSRVARYLLMRGKEVVSKWQVDNIFEEKQNDTADILLVDSMETNKFHIIDVKTKNLSKKAQQPNIISSEKLAKACALMIENNDYDSILITYIGISWIIDDGYLVCKDVAVKNLFKSQPSTLYINWVAAQQIQFHVDELEQNFEGTAEEWCREYIRNYISSGKKYFLKKVEKMESFEKILAN
jgi:hypothetical protein